MTTLGELYKDIRAQLAGAGLEPADMEARLIMGAAGGLSRADLIMRAEAPAAAKLTAKASAIVKRRLAREPLDHILGERYFYGRAFEISKEVLSPRPETELLVTEALERLRGIKAPRVLDLGTGSGAIIITLLAELADAQGVAVDISGPALDIAKRNAERHKAAHRLDFIQASWFEGISLEGAALKGVSGRFDMIVSNPPYIDKAALGRLMPEVQNYDPAAALDGGPDGLAAYREIMPRARDFLSPGGYLLLEIGFDQALAVMDLARANGYTDINLLLDFAGHDRVITAKTPL